MPRGYYMGRGGYRASLRDVQATPAPQLETQAETPRQIYARGRRGYREVPAFLNTPKKAPSKESQMPGAFSMFKEAYGSPIKGFVNDLGNPDTGAGKFTKGVSSVFPGKQTGEAIGTLAGYIASPNKEYYDTKAPTPLQVAGDIAQGALMVGAPKLAGTATTALGRIGQSAAIGAGLGGTEGIKQRDNAKDIFKSSLKGGLIGGALGTVSEGLAKILQGSLNPKAYSTIDNHMKTAQKVATDLSRSQLRNPRVMQSFLGGNKVDLMRQLESDGFYKLASKVNALDISGINDVPSYLNAITRTFLPAANVPSAGLMGIPAVMNAIPK